MIFILGLKDLADFLPATLGTIVSYLSSEVTRCIWKPAFMNGTDWPSPAANLSIVEQQIKKILAATGVDVPSLAIGLLSLLSLFVEISIKQKSLAKSLFARSFYPFLGDFCSIVIFSL